MLIISLLFFGGGVKKMIFLCPHSDTYLSVSRVEDDDDDGDSDDCGGSARKKENSPVRIKMCLTWGRTQQAQCEVGERYKLVERGSEKRRSGRWEGKH